MRRFFAIILAATLSTVPAAAASPTDTPLRIVNTLGDFDRVWSATKELPDAQRVEAFKDGFADVLPGFYDPKRVADFTDADRYHALILKGLKDYGDQREAIQRVGRDFETLAGPARREFEDAFGPMTGYAPVYIVNSFGEFDGGTRDLADGNHLLFGADVIARIYQGVAIKPFVQHELFHLYHARRFGECEPIYCNLWIEGLATHVAATMNPGADDAAIGLTLPQPIRAPVDARFAEAVCAVRARLDSEQTDDYAPLFYGSKNLPGFPPRMGYYIGLRVVQDIGKNRDLKTLAAMTPAEVRPLIAASLDGMADCGGNGAPVGRD